MTTPHRQRYMLLGALVAAVVITGMFGVRAFHSARHFRGGPVREIRPWMPIRMIARAYDVPPPVLLDALGLQPDSPDSRAPINTIARRQNRPVSEVITTLKQAIEKFHAAPHGLPPLPPTPPPPPTPAADRGNAAYA